MRSKLSLVFGSVVCVFFVGEALARDYVWVAGSSTVRPYAEIVAEEISGSLSGSEVEIEGGGSTGVLRRFCEGVGAQTIDIAMTSRSMRSREYETCQANGVTEIDEVLIGTLTFVLAFDRNQPRMHLSPTDMYRAVAAQIVVDGELVPNPNSNWRDIRSDYQDMEITLYIPAPNQSARIVFDENLLLRGCRGSGAFQTMLSMGMRESDAEEVCTSLRSDGGAVEVSGSDSAMLDLIESNHDGVGIFSLSFYENNSDRLQLAELVEVDPLSLPLFFYVKSAHIDVIPGLRDYVEFLPSADFSDTPLETCDEPPCPCPQQSEDPTSDFVQSCRPR